MTSALLVIATVAGEGDWLDRFAQWAKIESGLDWALVIFGVIAQVMFFGRWLVQWIASERRGESHVPVLFWWLSLVGATMLLLYFIMRGEPVGVLGQSIGWTVYTRNLMLIKRKQRELDAGSEPGRDS